MHKKILQHHNAGEVKAHEILTILLRLRQICCHPHLITAMLQEGDRGADRMEDEEGSEEEMHMDLLEKINKLNLDDEDPTEEIGISDVGQGTLAESAGRVLNAANPVFKEDRRSSKIAAVMELLKTKILNVGEKAIIVSQWSSLLRLVSLHLRDEGIVFEQLDGTIPVLKRMPLVNNFNDPHHKTRILLLSLTAGGVGLNLIGGNHLLLLDLHWNPQLECQAQDRIYRVGQQKPVHVYKFMCLNTIEERIKALQEMKLQIADAVLTGTKISSANKLSIQDLKMLFNM